MFNAGGTTAITRSAFSQNSASTGGGILNTGGSVSLTRSTVTDNSARFGGGGIATEDGALTVRSSTLSGNTAADPNGGGGGIFNSIFEAASSTVDIANSTMSQNSGAFGGAIINVGTLTVSRSTLTENSASSGGGIYNGNSDPVVGSATLAASINAANAGGNCSGTGTATSHGYNLTGPDCGFASTGDQTVADSTAAIGMGQLADNGGPTQTMALLSTSPAVDAIPTGAVAVDGTTPLCPVFGTVDQRGAFRPRGTGCDIGAFERQAETTRTVIDFTTSPGGVFDPNFYELDGIVFPSQRCGSAGCAPWFIGFVQGDQALIQSPVFGPVTATFTSPISGLSLQIAPASQGTAIYTLTALSGSGEVLGTMSRTITQDSGDPEDGPPGYFTMTLESLQTPAASFILDSEFVRSSFGNNAIEYGVSSIDLCALIADRALIEPSVGNSVARAGRGAGGDWARDGRLLNSRKRIGRILAVALFCAPLIAMTPNSFRAATPLGAILFTARDGAHGRELWVSDGTPSGSSMVKDISPGPNGSRPGWLVAVGGTVFFKADDGEHGGELWMSDGTESGTVLVIDISLGLAGSEPRKLTEVGGICTSRPTTAFMDENSGRAMGPIPARRSSKTYDRGRKAPVPRA